MALFTDFCYDSMFPIRLMGTIDIQASLGDVSPPAAAAKPLPPWPGGCFCYRYVFGIPVPTPGTLRGAWIPVSVIEATRAPGCLVMLEGYDLGLGSMIARSGGENRRGAEGEVTGGFRHFNMYDFPLSETFADILGFYQCAGLGSSMESMMTSAILPFWNRADLANLIFPEAYAFSNAAAVLAGPISCAADTLAGPAGGLVDDAMIWNMGCWGRTYPLMGAYGTQGQVSGTSLVAARAMYTMNAISRYVGGIASKYGVTTMGEAVANAGCKPLPSPVLRKSEYKMGMLFPVPESGIGVATAHNPSTGGAISASPLGMLLSRCNHRIGASEYLWGPYRKGQVTGEDAAYLVWRWVDCCQY
jgi:conjugal transfer pilus assembly protein TraU